MYKRFLFLAFLFIFTNILVAQLSNPVTIPPSPQSEAFMKYGDYSINYSTGVPNISVPLHEINHHGFKIPVSLNYYHQGVKPGYNVDVFGLGWGLNPTGKISREIRYQPDEANDFVVDVIDANTSLSGIYGNPRNTNFSLDLFHVSLPSGLSFDFVMEKDTNNNTYKVSTSKGEPVIVNYLDKYNPAGGTWEIIDKNGVKYTFLVSDSEEVLYGSNGGSISTWNLSRIDLPHSNEAITYNYVKGILNNFLDADYTKCISTNVGLNGYGQCGDQYTPNSLKYNSYLLKQVKYGNTDINFTYNNNTSQYIAHNFIKSVNISEVGGDLVKKITFNMSNHTLYTPHQIPLMQLDDISISGSGETLPPQKYKFAYDPFSSFTFMTDHWGYLNGSYVDPSDRFPPFHIWLHTTAASNTCYDGAEVITSGSISKIKLGNADRNPGGQHGVLNKITYPTGGYTEFTFERNMYERKMQTGDTYIPTAAGFRIAQIANYTSDNNLALKKTYKYGALSDLGGYDIFGVEHTNLGIAPVEPNALSYLKYRETGQIYTVGNHWLGEELKPGTGVAPVPAPDSAMEHCFSSSVFRSILNGRPPVVYPEVTVYTGEFRNGQTTVDKTLGKTVYKYDYLHPEFIEPWGFKMDGASSYIPKSYMYNILLEQTDYKREDQDMGQAGIQSVYTPVRKIENSWHYSTRDVSSENKLFRIVPTYYPGSANQFFRNYGINTERHIPLLMQKTTTEYLKGIDPVKIIEDMSYSYDGFLTERRIKNSDTKITVHRYKYPKSYTTNPLPIIETMRNDTNHIISPIIESSTTIKNDQLGPGTFVSGTKTDYKEFTIGANTIIMPEKGIYFDKSGTGIGAEITNLTIEKYTTNGKAEQVLNKDGLRTSYLWGYKDRYLVAKVDNASITQVEATLTANELTNIKNGTYDRSTMISKLNKIRAGLSSAMVTTYTYNPLIGITSMTNPTGETIYYEYDEFGRLEKVKDKDEYLLNETEYNYKQ